MAEKQLGDFLKRIKRPIELQPNKRYKLVTIKLYQKGVDLRTEKRGSEIKSPMSIVRAGDFILSGIDARNGAFGIVPTELDGAVVTNDFWCLEIDPLVIDKRLFLELTTATWFNEICRQCSSGTTQRIRLDKRLFFQHTIQLPPLEDQPKILSAILRIKAQQSELQHLFQERAVLIKQLRASLLQEAISGQMTAEWRLNYPNTEPAHILLNRIAEEKAELVRTKQIKKEKPLPPVSDDDTLFDIPSGWEWMRLGDACSTSSGGTPSRSNASFWSGNITWYKSGEMTDVPSPLISNSEEQISDEGLNSSSARIFQPGTLLIAMYGATAGKMSILGVPAATNQAVCGVVPIPNGIDTIFLFRHIEASRPKILADSWGMSQPNISQTYLRGFVVPLPPLEEQKEIVRRLEAKLKAVQGLQDKLNEDLETAQTLLKAKLKEVFEKTDAQPTASLSPSV